MKGNPASVSVLALAGCLGCLGLMSAAAQTMAPSAAHMANLANMADLAALANFQFDIPAQPLAAALDVYGAITGRPVLFRSTLAADRVSFPLLGKYSADAALHILLKGTGLAIAEVGNAETDAFVLKLAAAQDAAATAAAATMATPADANGMSAYDGAVQAGIWQAFCNNPDTRPGAYRSLLRFQIDGDGRIGHVRLLGSSGDGNRDAQLLQTLKRVRVDPPPPDMPQPLTMLILPRNAAAGAASPPACVGEAR